MQEHCSQIWLKMPPEIFKNLIRPEAEVATLDPTKSEHLSLCYCSHEVELQMATTWLFDLLKNGNYLWAFISFRFAYNTISSVHL